MGAVAGRGMKQGRDVLECPADRLRIGDALCRRGDRGAVSPGPSGLSAGGAALLLTLAASASYIAVPAAMRLALPEARPSVYLTLSLGVTFPTEPDTRHSRLCGGSASGSREPDDDANPYVESN